MMILTRFNPFTQRPPRGMWVARVSFGSQQEMLEHYARVKLLRDDHERATVVREMRGDDAGDETEG